MIKHGRLYLAMLAFSATVWLPAIPASAETRVERYNRVTGAAPAYCAKIVSQIVRYPEVRPGYKRRSKFWASDCTRHLTECYDKGKVLSGKWITQCKQLIHSRYYSLWCDWDRKTHWCKGLLKTHMRNSRKMGMVAWCQGFNNCAQFMAK